MLTTKRSAQHWMFELKEIKLERNTQSKVSVWCDKYIYIYCTYKVYCFYTCGKTVTDNIQIHDAHIWLKQKPQPIEKKSLNTIFLPAEWSLTNIKLFKKLREFTPCYNNSNI